MSRAQNDGDLVKLARQIDSHLRAVAEIIDKVSCLNHSRAARAAEDLSRQCYQPAWATHVIHKHLYSPSDWETGDWGIRHKTATKSVRARSSIRESR